MQDVTRRDAILHQSGMGAFRADCASTAPMAFCLQGVVQQRHFLDRHGRPVVFTFPGGRETFVKLLRLCEAASEWTLDGRVCEDT